MKTGSDSAVARNGIAELTFVAEERHTCPLDRIALLCSVTGPSGETVNIPAYWAGGDVWRVRFTSDAVGRHAYRTACSAAHDAGLHDRTGVIDVTEYVGSNPLFRHGPLCLSHDGLHLMHADGMPFFWLGDTWWLAGSGSFRWPDVFQTLTADRVKKGFTVVQLVAGLFPEVEPFHPRAANEGGFAWSDGYSEINPAFFDMFDLKFALLVQSGIVPCLVGAWGQYLGLAGIDVIKRHWRYLVARYGAFPVVWCIAGEASLFPTAHEFLTGRNEGDMAAIIEEQHRAWAEVTREVRALDPYHRLITVHPCPIATYRSSQVLHDPSLYDIDMLQTGHTDRHCFHATLLHVTAAVQERQKPVINGEVCYEGIFGNNWHDTQRFLFWTHLLSGTAGHTYGTFGISTFSARDDRYIGQSRCSDEPWEDAFDLPGSHHMGIGKRFFERYDWQEFEPHPEWVEPHWTDDDRILPYAAGIRGRIRVVYFPSMGFLNPHGALADWPVSLRRITLVGLEPRLEYSAYYVNPRTGGELPRFGVATDTGEFVLSTGSEPWASGNPTGEDWVLVLEAYNQGAQHATV